MDERADGATAGARSGSRTAAVAGAPAEAGLAAGGDREPFFIGWAGVPAGLRVFLAVVAFVSIAGFTALAYVVAATQPDPGDGAFRWDWGALTVTGTMTNAPYPVLHVTESDRFAAGTPLILSGPGKIGVQERTAALEGQTVSLTGVALTRGDLAGFQVGGGSDDVRPVETTPPAPVPVTDLGRWRITGEICDGKCYLGAMRPGAGLAHKACANLCIIGGVPPVFVSTGPIAGETFLLLGNADGGPLPSAVLDQTATLVEVEGRVERRGELLVFLVDPASVRLAR